MAQGLTKSGDVSRVESVFFGSDEDLNAKSEKLLTALRENKEFTDSPKRTAGDPKKKTPEKKESEKDVKESKKEGAKSE
jgi:hypothetical protein